MLHARPRLNPACSWHCMTSQKVQAKWRMCYNSNLTLYSIGAGPAAVHLTGSDQAEGAAGLSGMCLIRLCFHSASASEQWLYSWCDVVNCCLCTAEQIQDPRGQLPGGGRGDAAAGTAATAAATAGWWAARRPCRPVMTGRAVAVGSRQPCSVLDMTDAMCFHSQISHWTEQCDGSFPE